MDWWRYKYTGPWRILDECRANYHNTASARKKQANGERCVCPGAFILRRRMDLARQQEDQLAARRRASEARRIARHREVPQTRHYGDRGEGISRVNEAPIPRFDQAECSEPSAREFFDKLHPTNGEDPGRAAIAGAREVCDRCPLLAECRRWVLAAEVRPGQWSGMFGGLLPKERRGMRREYVA